MDKIKKQIDSLIVFKGTTFKEVRAEYDVVRARIEDGVNRMKDATVFSEEEIKSITNWSLDMLQARYNASRRIIHEKMRDSFQF